MATGTMKATITLIDNTQKNIVAFGTVAISAATDTYATGGLVMTGFLSDQIKTNQTAPNILEIMTMPAAGTSPSGYSYIYCYGTTLDNGKVAIMNGTTEFSNAAALTAPAADVLIFRASYQRV